MKIRAHKDILIQLLMDHPEELPELLPGWEGTVEEAIQALEEDPRDYLDEFQN